MELPTIAIVFCCLLRSNISATETISVEPTVFSEVGVHMLRFTRMLTDEELSFNVSTTAGSAIDGKDYIGIPSQTLTFGIGVPQVTFPLTILHSDRTGNKLFIVALNSQAPITPPDFDMTVLEDAKGPLTTYDCRRPGQDCFNDGNCSSESIKCSCPSPFFGDMCNFDLTFESSSLDCGGHGKEHTPASLGDSNCTCDPGYYGDKCESYYLFARCDNESMTAYINPVGTFTGAIYVEGKFGVSACQFQPVESNDEGIEGFSLEIPHDSSVCGEIVEVDDGKGDLALNRSFIVQYYEFYQATFDQLILVKCKADNASYTVVGQGNPFSFGPNDFFKEHVSIDFIPVKVENYLPDGSLTANGGVLRVGQAVTTKVTVGQGLMGVEVNRILFKNSPDSANQEVSTVYSSGCRSDAGKSILHGPPSYPTATKNVLEFSFDVFKFANSPQLLLEIDVKICTDPADCDIRSCPSGQKRAAGDAKERVIIEVFQVVDDVVDTGPVERKQQESTLVIIIVASVGAVTAIMFILAIYIVMKIMRPRQPKLIE